MSLPSGTRLGPYEIVAPLGAGGMGEVYRARDTRLGRDVAIKTLPAAFSHDPERRARFETEAKAVAALSHPNVLAIFDVGIEGDTTYAVMELVEGQTLRERLQDGALSGPRATGIAMQLANGLGAAHDKGVIHRDLKPENIMLTPDGQAKILDFGLARLTTPVPAGSQSMAPTELAGTTPGMVLGTTDYLSPEQVRGNTADERSDIFALGTVIYEMLAGHRAFHAETPAETMTAILREDPPEIARFTPDVSPATERIVRRCLEKQPAARFRSAADLAYALEAISSVSSAAHAKLTGTLAPADQPRFKRLTFRNGIVAGARFVPDGSGVVFGASWEGKPFEIFSAHPGSPDARSLGLPPANLLSISRSGELALSLGYEHTFWNQVSGTLARTALGGGGVRPLQKGVGHASWSHDGQAMAVIRYAQGCCRLEYPAGTVRVETADWLSHAGVSRDGMHVAYARHTYVGDSAGDICVLAAAGDSRVLLSDMTSISGIAWSPSGDEIWCSGINAELQNSIWGVRLDGSQREIYTSPARVTLHDVAADGRALIGLGNLRIGLSASTALEVREKDLSWFDGSVVSDISADGSQVLFYEGHEAGNPKYACYMRDLSGSPAVRLADGYTTRLSADGLWLLVITLRPEHGLHLYPTGFGEPRSIPLPGIDLILWAGFHPDGKRLFVAGSSPGRSGRLYLVGIDGGTLDLLWDEQIEFDRLGGLAIAPDGESVIFRRACAEPVLFSCRTRTVEPLAFVGEDEVPMRFDSSGRYLFVASRGTADRTVNRIDMSSGERTEWRKLEPPDPIGVIFIGHPCISPDGSTLAYSYFRHTADLYLVEGLR